MSEGNLADMDKQREGIAHDSQLRTPDGNDRKDTRKLQARNIPVIPQRNSEEDKRATTNVQNRFALFFFSFYYLFYSLLFSLS